VTATEQYQQARDRAQEVRKTYNLTTPRVMVSDLKKIYRAEGIERVDYYAGFKSTRIRGAYFNDSAGRTVMINKKLMTQTDPKVFTLGHELKHHLMDDVHEVSLCSDNNEHVVMERAADVFASELIYPTDMFMGHMAERLIGKGQCGAEEIVRLKHDTNTTLSHAALSIRASRLGYALPNAFNGIMWNNLRDKLYPEYQAFRRSYRRVYL
jgi:Zn-dependent peptidase ImmA (M78 family)